jgi:hypothetical protein
VTVKDPNSQTTRCMVLRMIFMTQLNVVAVESTWAHDEVIFYDVDYVICHVFRAKMPKESPRHFTV